MELTFMKNTGFRGGKGSGMNPLIRTQWGGVCDDHAQTGGWAKGKD